MIRPKYYCDHCDKEMDSETYDKNKITFTWEDKYCTESSTYHFCDECDKELWKFVNRNAALLS